MVTPKLNNKTNKQELLLSLARWMAGEFSNQKQAFAQPQTFAHIRVFFRPLFFDFFGGIGFYSEQVYDYDLWSPYRQGVHRFIDRGDNIYVENYGLKDPILYAGSGRDRSILKTITTDCIERRYHCSMIFKKQDNLFYGSVEPGNNCLIERNGLMTYLVSEVELSENTFISLDRGMDVNTHEQIWGSKAGALRFEKQKSFADEVPNLLTEM
jgi:CpeT protein